MGLGVLIVGSLGILAGVLGLIAVRRVSEVERIFHDFRRREADQISGISQRVSAIVKQVAEIHQRLASLERATGSLGEPLQTQQPAVSSSNLGAYTSTAGQKADTSGMSDDVIDEADEYVNFDCIHCGQNIEAPQLMAGTTVACPTCGRLIQIPAKSTSAPPVLTSPQITEVERSGLGQDFLKGATIRINISQLATLPEKKKRQIVIRRKR